MTSNEWGIVLGIFAIILTALGLPVLIVGVRILTGVATLGQKLDNLAANHERIENNHTSLWSAHGETTGKLNTHDILLARIVDKMELPKAQ